MTGRPYERRASIHSTNVNQRPTERARNGLVNWIFALVNQRLGNVSSTATSACCRRISGISGIVLRAQQVGILSVRGRLVHLLQNSQWHRFTQFAARVDVVFIVIYTDTRRRRRRRARADSARTTAYRLFTLVYYYYHQTSPPAPPPFQNHDAVAQRRQHELARSRNATLHFAASGQASALELEPVGVVVV